MGYHLEINSLLVVPNEKISGLTVEKGQAFQLEKEGERLYPVNIPIEFCNENYQYLGKAAIRRITIEKDKSILEVEILKVFSEEEAEVFTSNFIKL